MGRGQRGRSEQPEIRLSEVELDDLLGVLCVELGFCQPQNGWDSLISSPPTDIDDFTRAVFIADGMDPDTSPAELYRQVRDRVAQAFAAHGTTS